MTRLAVCNTGTGRIGVTGTQVMLAVIALHRAGPVTLRGVARHLGLGYSTVWHHLGLLRAAGLVTWVPGTGGTIRPAVEVVPV